MDIFFGCAPGKWDMYVCANCGASFLNPRPTRETIHLAYRDYYTHAETGKNEHRSLGISKYLKRAIKRAYINIAYRPEKETFISRALFHALTRHDSRAKRELERWVRHLPPPGTSERRLLDIGCGNGYFIKIAEMTGWEPIGIDFDGKALEAAKNNGARVLSGDVYSIPISSDSVDYVTLNHVIEHLHDPLTALIEIKRVLKNKGILWIGTPNINSSAHYCSGRLWRGLEPPRHLMIYTLRALEIILTKAGFTNVSNRSVYRHDKDNWELIVTAEKR